ncbi:MAG: hypothetical protein AAGD00_04580 [Planctomycetota bacterium]
MKRLSGDMVERAANITAIAVPASTEAADAGCCHGSGERADGQPCTGTTDASHKAEVCDKAKPAAS